MNILVTGGAGFIGSHTIDALVAAGHAVCAFDNLSSGNAANLGRHAAHVRLFEGDLRDAARVRDVVTESQCDAIMHLAALVSVPRSLQVPIETIEINTSGTAHVLEGARLSPRSPRVVLASTSALYGDLPGRKREEDALMPLAPYATSKLMAEQLCEIYARCYGLSVARLRYFNVYGPRQRADSPYSGVLAKWTHAIEAGAPCLVFGDGENTRDFVHVRDVARVNVLALTAPQAAPNPLFNVATGRSVSLNQILAALKRVSELPVTVEYHPARAADIAHSAADNGRVCAALGWVPGVSLDDGLRELLKSSH